MNGSKTQIRDLFTYMRWADEQMLMAAATTPEDGYFKDQGISFGSIHKLLVHGMSAQSVWLSRWKRQPLKNFLTDIEFPTRASLAEQWPKVHDALFTFLDMQTDQSLATPLNYHDMAGNPYSAPLGALMLHVIDHATYHRGQINSMIKLAGGTPWNGSLVRFVTQTPS